MIAINAKSRWLQLDLSYCNLYFLIIVGTLLLQFALVSWTFPLTELWSDHLQYHIDAAYHWYQLKLAVNMAQTGNLIGYDPFFNAGYPAGTLDSSARFPAALAIMFHPWLTEASVYKMSSFLSAVLGPVFITLAARQLKLSTYQAIVATVFGFILWWTSMFRWYHTAGMVTYVMASYAALWYLALVIRCQNEPGNRKLLIVTGIIGAILFFYHPLFPLPVVFGTLIYWGIHYQQLNLKAVIKSTGVITILALLPNLFWLYPYYHYQSVFVNGVAQPYQKLADINLIWQWTLGSNWGTKLNAVLVFASLWACIGLRTPYERKLAWCFTLIGWLLVCFAALAGAIPVVNFLQPNRFSPTGYLMMTIPAAMGVAYMLRSFRQDGKRWLQLLNALSLFVVVSVTVYCLNEVRCELSYADIGHYGKRPPEVTHLGEYSRWIPDWLKRETTPAGRILFEIPVGRVYDNANIAGYYAYTSDREFIGGPYPFMFFSSFWDGWLFGKPITSINTFEFQRYLDLYNIGWIIVHSDVSKKYLESIPQIEFMDEYKKLRAYKVNKPLDFFIEGKGIILERGHNKLLLSELEGDSVTLKYHFVPDMKSEPPTTLVPVKMLDDPNPFIRIIHPPKKVLLYMP